jgi:tRNA (Thr-GGU) A37 N-methylase
VCWWRLRHVARLAELPTWKPDVIVPWTSSEALGFLQAAQTSAEPGWLHLSSRGIVARDGLRIEVDALEAIDGTPVVDVKPAIDPPA